MVEVDVQDGWVESIENGKRPLFVKRIGAFIGGGVLRLGLGLSPNPGLERNMMT